jgi:PASTA domain
MKRPTDMPERWERELEKLTSVDAPSSTRARVADGPHGEGMPPSPRRGQRVAAGFVAFVVFGAALALLAGAFRGPGTLATTSPDPESNVVVHLSSVDGPNARLVFMDRTAEPQIGRYCWAGTSGCTAPVLTPFVNADFVQVPSGTPIAIVGDDALTSAEATVERSTDPMALNRQFGLSVPIHAVDLADGRYVVIVDATWPQGSVQFYFPIEVTGPAHLPPSSAGPILTALLEAPRDGSIPVLSLSDQYRSSRFFATDGNWPGVTSSPSPLQSFEGAIEPGTTLTLYGDAEKVEGRLFVADADEHLTGESIPLELTPGGGATLPDYAGYFRLILVGRWPHGSAGFSVGITIGTPTDPPSPSSVTVGVVPDVIGLDERDAIVAVKEAGFVAVGVFAPAKLPAGVVISSDPPAGAHADVETTVTLTVSTGH